MSIRFYQIKINKMIQNKRRNNKITINHMINVSTREFFKGKFLDQKKKLLYLLHAKFKKYKRLRDF